MDRTTPGDGSALSRAFKLSAVILAALLGAAAIWGADKQSLGLFHDDGIYAVVAKAISQGEGYRIISLPGEPEQTKYPFLYSYLLSWLWSLNPDFPGNILLLKSFNIAVLLAIFVLSLALYHRVFPTARLGAAVFGVLVCINPLVFSYTDFVVSDLLFVLFASLALVISRMEVNSAAGVLRLGAIGGLACLTRLAAAPLALAGLVESIRRHGIKGAGYFAAVAGVFIAPWLYWVWSHPNSSFALLSYYSAYEFAGATGESGEVLARHAEIVYGNARYLLGAFNLFYLLPLLPVLTPFAVGLTLLGMAVSRRSTDFFSWIFFISSVGLLLAWPFHPVRYVAPLVPLLVLFLFRGMAAAECWLDARGGEYALKPLVSKLPWLTAVLLLVLQGVWISSYLLIRDPHTTRGSFGNRMKYGWSGFEETFAWLRQNTPAGAKLATAYDPMYFLYTGRQAIRPALHRSATYFYPYGAAKADVGSAAEIKAELDSLRIDYLIIDPMDGYAEGNATIRLMEDLVASYGESAKPVFTSTDRKHRIYALR